MPNRKQIAVILAGCGVYDGSEIQEAIFTLWAIEKAGAVYKIFAPDIDQMHVINHLSGDVMPGKRNVLTEAARIARGKISPLSSLDPDLFHAVLIPGGYGVAKNLCTFATQGIDCTVNAEIEKVIKKFHQRKKPIGALCISPALITKILGDVNVTIGKDAETASAIEAMGGHHVNAQHGDVVIDDVNKIFTTPCYMLEASITQVASDIDNLVSKLISTLE